MVHAVRDPALMHLTDAARPPLIEGSDGYTATGAMFLLEGGVRYASRPRGRLDRESVWVAIATRR